MGGLERHVQCLVQSLPQEVESLICITGYDGPTSDTMREAGLNVVTLGCSCGHDLLLLPRFHKILRDFRPDIIHGHSSAFLVLMYLRYFSNLPLIQSLHVPADKKTFRGILWRTFTKKPDFYLPVSAETWKGYKQICPNLKGEVLFNPLLLNTLPQKDSSYIRQQLGLADEVPIVGAVGRFAPKKNWTSFLNISYKLLSQNAKLHIIAVGDGPNKDEIYSKWLKMTYDKEVIAQRLHWLGNRQDARQLIGGMDVFLLLSRHEEMPTVLLEAFGMKTPVVGFLPRGGTKEVLALSERESALLIKERHIDAVVKNIQIILDDKWRAQSMVEEGQKILGTYFDSEKICRNQLLPIYKKVIENCEEAL